ncbi:MAG: GspH/FimT family pseudopilin [Desulfosudaceae bacterium]
MKNNQGVTLAELIISVAVVGVVATFGGISFLKGMPERRVAAATRDVYAWVQKARSEAVKTCRPVKLAFDVGRDRLALMDEDGQPLMSYALDDRIDLYQVTGGNPLTFNPRGMKIGHSGNVYLSYGDGNHTRRVRITSVGSIAIQYPWDGHGNWIYPGQGQEGDSDDCDEDKNDKE